MLSVSPEHLAVVRAVLCRFLPAGTCYAFGSRTRPSHHPYSDLDVAVRAPEPLPLATLSALEEAFAESDLPFRVDVVDLNRAGADFVRLIERDFVPL